MELTLTKIETFKLEPYGKFCFKWHSPRTGSLKPHQILIYEIIMKQETRMPASKEQTNEIINVMKKNKTDVLTDGYKFYTLSNDDLIEIWHEKLAKYKEDPAYKSVVDEVERFI